MSAQEVLVADAIAGELNDPGRPWAPLDTAAAATWSPWYDADKGELDTLRLSVVPTMYPRTDTADRAGLRMFDLECWVDLQKRVTVNDDGRPDKAKIDALCLTAQQVVDFFHAPGAHPLAGVPGWHVIKAEREIVFDENILFEHHTFMTAVKLTVRGFR